MPGFRNPRDFIFHFGGRDRIFSSLGLVLSGGGVRAAYQAGFLKGLTSKLDVDFHVMVGSSVGSINAFLLSLTVKHGIKSAVENLVNLWLARRFDNTFEPFKVLDFVKGLFWAIKLRRLNSIPVPKSSILNPKPLYELLERLRLEYGGIKTNEANLKGVGLMTTMVEQTDRRGVFFVQCTEDVKKFFNHSKLYTVRFVNELTASHCLASAALPTIMPPFKLDFESNDAIFIDGGFVQNIPIDPAVRLGADCVLVIDVSGRNFWKKSLGLSPDSKPSWELANFEKDYCVSPKVLVYEEVSEPLGPILKDLVIGRRLKEFGPIYPLFKFLESKLGEDLAFEAATYVTLNPDFVRELIRRGIDSGRSKAHQICQKINSFQATN